MFDKHLKDAAAVRGIWAPLLKEWALTVDEADGMNYWAKKCPILTVFLFNIEPTIFAVEFLSADDKVIYEQRLNSVEESSAKTEASELISEFVCRGFEALSGFAINMERPHNEVRIQQAFVVEEEYSNTPGKYSDTIHGIGTDGVLYRFDGDSWRPLPMKAER